MARPTGSRQARPTREAIRNYYRMLNNAAQSGDVHAAGWLLNLEQQRQATKPQEKDQANV